MGETLFDTALREAQAAAAPLAVRLRPARLDEVVGQGHLRAAGSPLSRLVSGDGSVPGVILFGPPGTGKTSLAYLASAVTGRRFVELSAVSAGVKEVRGALQVALQERALHGRETVLFVDEVHRFSRTQQDALLPAVENRDVTLVAATTQNPSFSVVAPLLSRCLLLTLTPLEDADLRELLGRALTDPRGYGGRVRLGDGVAEHLVRLADGDARRLLTALEAAAGPVRDPAPDVSLELLEQAVDRIAVRYDRDGDQHYDVISAFIKSVRGSDPDASLHYLARMIEAGEDPRFVARRLVVLASEDIGLADPSALQVAVAAAAALDLVGLPEARLALAQATVALAVAPKSNSVLAAYDAAAADVRAGRGGPVPPPLRDRHYPGATRVGAEPGYRYPHDFPAGWVSQQYAPDALTGTVYYRPTAHGQEGVIGARLAARRGGAEADPAGAPAHRSTDEQGSSR